MNIPPATITVNCGGRPKVGTPVSLYHVVAGNPFATFIESGATNFNGQYTPTTILTQGESYTFDITVGPFQQYPFGPLERNYYITGDYTVANWHEENYQRRLYILFPVGADPVRLWVNLTPCEPRGRFQQQQAPQQIIIQPQEQQQPGPDYTPYIITGVVTIAATVISALAIYYGSRSDKK